jgi:hypothetical protein
MVVMGVSYDVLFASVFFTDSQKVFQTLGPDVFPELQFLGKRVLVSFF